MDNSTNFNIIDKAKNDISESGQEITNSIEAFNNHLNKAEIVMNPKNISQNSNYSFKDQNLKTSSDIDALKESSSITTSFNKVNFKIKPNIPPKLKIADPASDIIYKNLQQKIDSLNYDNFVLKKKNKDLITKNEELNFKFNSDIHNKKTEIMQLNELLDNAKNILKEKDKEIYELNEKMKN